MKKTQILYLDKIFGRK